MNPHLGGMANHAGVGEANGQALPTVQNDWMLDIVSDFAQTIDTTGGLH